MKKISSLIIGLLLITGVFAQTTKDKVKLITKNITYDVVIKNPNTEPDTWNSFLTESARLEFLNEVIKQVLSGEVQAYVASEKFQVVNPEELKKRFNWDRNKPFSAETDTINDWIHLNRITKIRYYEEWTINPKTTLINKRILGIAPILDLYDDKATFRGTEPIFFIFYDSAFKEKMINRK